MSRSDCNLHLNTARLGNNATAYPTSIFIVSNNLDSFSYHITNSQGENKENHGSMKQLSIGLVLTFEFLTTTGCFNPAIVRKNGLSEQKREREN